MAPVTLPTPVHRYLQICYGTGRYHRKGRSIKTSQEAAATRSASGPTPLARERILHAAMDAFIRHGFAESSTLAIARRARVSKRDLYAHFGTKRAILAAGIAQRAQRMRLPGALQVARNRTELESVLVRFGAAFLREILDPAVIAVYRLAITEARRAPELARTLDTAGQQPVRAGMRRILVDAQAAGLIGDGDLDVMTGQYFALLWGDLQMAALLRITAAPGTAEQKARAAEAAAALLALHAPRRVQRPAARTRRAGARRRRTGTHQGGPLIR